MKIDPHMIAACLASCALNYAFLKHSPIMALLAGCLYALAVLP